MDELWPLGRTARALGVSETTLRSPLWERTVLPPAQRHPRTNARLYRPEDVARVLSEKTPQSE
jgi:DNA-binding transcriptional MerR regulator